MKKIKAFFDNGRSKREEERVESSDYAAAIAKLPKLETLAVNLNIIDSLPLTGSKVGFAAAFLFTWSYLRYFEHCVEVQGLCSGYFSHRLGQIMFVSIHCSFYFLLVVTANTKIGPTLNFNISHRQEKNYPLFSFSHGLIIFKDDNAHE